MNDTSTHTKPDTDQQAALPSSELTGDPVPDRILIAPWGRVDSTNGRFVVDDESAQQVIDAFAAHGTDLPIDYEHQTLGGRYASPSGTAPAAGWIQAIEAEPGVGLFARVRWTDAAREHLAAGQYRYLSPVAVVRAADRKLIALHSAALTNKPAIVGRKPIVNGDGPDVDREAALLVLRQQLGLAGDCPDADLLMTVSHRLAELEHERLRREAQARLEPALQSGRLCEAQREWALRLALRDAELFDEWLRTAPVLHATGRTQAPDRLSPHAAAHHVESAARAEFRACPGLAGLTTEDAFVADALRRHQRIAG
ncbi:MAG: hypothetical protein JXB13_12420 [Phycisphaerae bacterium]|nr:hypothetical protein [Phycisphaerae bacterium]